MPGVVTVSAEMNQRLTLGQALCSRLFTHYLILTVQRLCKAVSVVPVLQRKKLRFGDIKILAHDQH